MPFFIAQKKSKMTSLDDLLAAAPRFLSKLRFYNCHRRTLRTNWHSEIKTFTTENHQSRPIYPRIILEKQLSSSNEFSYLKIEELPCVFLVEEVAKNSLVLSFDLEKLHPRRCFIIMEIEGPTRSKILKQIDFKRIIAAVPHSLIFFCFQEWITDWCCGNSFQSQDSTPNFISAYQNPGETAQEISPYSPSNKQQAFQVFPGTVSCITCPFSNSRPRVNSSSLPSR